MRATALPLAAILVLSACTAPRSGGGGGGAGDDDDDATPASVPFGPENEWFHAETSAVPEDLEGTGIGVGDVIADFVLMDQNGDDVQLYQFYGQVIQLILFAEWCGPCREEEPLVESTWVDLQDDGVVILAVMFEDYATQVPEEEDLDNWINDFGSTHPLVAGPGELAAMLNGGFPTLPVIGRDMRLINPDNFPFNADALAGYAAE